MCCGSPSPAAGWVRVDHRARCQALPREHGRQAARSKQDRPDGAASGQDQPNHLRAAGGVLIL
jgi:hypothetical protein